MNGTVCLYICRLNTEEQNDHSMTSLQIYLIVSILTYNLLSMYSVLVKDMLLCVLCFEKITLDVFILHMNLIYRFHQTFNRSDQMYFMYIYTDIPKNTSHRTEKIHRTLYTTHKYNYKYMVNVNVMLCISMNKIT